MELRELAWVVEARPGGWVRLKETDGPSVYLHFQQEGDAGRERFNLKTAVMRAGSDEVLSGRSWRRVPLLDVERFIATDRVRTALTFPCEETPPAVLEELDAYFDAGELPGHPSETGYISSGMLVSDAPEQDKAGKVPVLRPPEGRLTDEFLRDVATAYRWYTEAKQPPAPAMAEQADVPVRRVHRWVADARKRGLLPPARPGRAG
ncbi:hypothetical protein AB0H18_00665 [Streptomyces sp. NPDC020766]|uniref:hypothetical protein n=1 Tax=Streptomyces sp. NPDC020766 TaxID=3155011 RepID=UPI0033E5B989